VQSRVVDVESSARDMPKIYDSAQDGRGSALTLEVGQSSSWRRHRAHHRAPARSDGLRAA
jgi:hypothetical protein